jgi:hypothetical protein
MAINWKAINRSAASSIVVAIWVVAICAATGVPAQAEEAPLQGVWQVVEVAMTGPGARVVKPHSTLIIFSGRHYSRTEVHSEQPRPMLPDWANATADQLRAVWGPFVAEAGTFELRDDLLTLRPTVAKNPAAMVDAAFTALSYKLNANMLTLTQVRNQNGPSPNPATIKLTRVE